MNIRFVDADEARGLLAAEIAVDVGSHDGDGTSDQLRFAVLRHAASRLCPCSTRTLLTTVSTALDGMMGEDPDLLTILAADLEHLLAAGDLFVGNDPVTKRTLIYLSPPMFVRRARASVYLVGGFPEADWPLAERAETRGPYRRVSPPPPEEELRELGISELPTEVWLEHPLSTTALALLAALDECLDRAGPPGTLDELRILDPARRNDYYVGRFVPPARHTGRFVGRRRIKWGAPAWSYVELVNGEVQRFVDFPQLDLRFRACDEAWWAICAVDAARGTAQPIEVSASEPGVTLAFFMPMPRWVERRLRVFGELASRPSGALFAYTFSNVDSREEIEFLKELLWLGPVGQDVGA